MSQQTLVRESSPLVKLRNSCACLPPVPFPLGEAVELQHDLDLGGQQHASILRRRLPQAERHYSLPQFRCAADVAAFVKRDADFKPLVRHWVSSRIVPRTEADHRMPVACGAGWPGHGLTRVLSFGSLPAGRIR